MVGGVPIGEPAFVTEVMRALVAGDVSYIETTVTQLRDQPHAAWAACSADSSSEDRRRECRSTCRTPTSSSTRLARDGWPAARKRARTPRVPQGGREARAPQRRSYTAY